MHSGSGCTHIVDEEMVNTTSNGEDFVEYRCYDDGKEGDEVLPRRKFRRTT